MHTNTVIHAESRFQRRIVAPTRTERLLSAVGRFKTEDELSDPVAIHSGKRRLGVLGASILFSAAIAGSAVMNQNSAEKAERYEEKIEDCATALAGTPVNIEQDIETGLQAIPAEVFAEVRACKDAGGDIEFARRILRRT